MTLALTPLAILAAAAMLRGVWRARRQLTYTTLVSAARWAQVATCVWTVVLAISVMSTDSAHRLDALWYAAALVAVCPAIAVLGARRPGAGVWTTFVVLPLLAVLGWPLLTLMTGGDFRVLRLETPQLIGFTLVLLMGAGNYFGTRFSLSAALYLVALCLAAGSVSAVAPPALQGSTSARLLATLLLGVAVVLAERTARQGNPTSVGIDRLWSDYRDTFGIVWARRFQDRLNDIAAQQQWSAHLGDQSLVWDDESESESPETRDRIEQTFRWLLRRFVDPEWIDRRLTPSTDPPE